MDENVLRRKKEILDALYTVKVSQISTKWPVCSKMQKKKPPLSIQYINYAFQYVVRMIQVVCSVFLYFMFFYISSTKQTLECHTLVDSG